MTNESQTNNLQSISKDELKVIQRWRQVVVKGYGTLTLKIQAGRLKHSNFEDSVSHEEK